MRRTTLAIALATGALAVPGVALATSGDDSPTQPRPSTAPAQQQDRDHDCPEERGGGESGQTQL